MGMLIERIWRASGGRMLTYWERTELNLEDFPIFSELTLPTPLWLSCSIEHAQLSFHISFRLHVQSPPTCPTASSLCMSMHVSWRNGESCSQLLPHQTMALLLSMHWTHPRWRAHPSLHPGWSSPEIGEGLHGEGQEGEEGIRGWLWPAKDNKVGLGVVFLINFVSETMHSYLTLLTY